MTEKQQEKKNKNGFASLLLHDAQVSGVTILEENDVDYSIVLNIKILKSNQGKLERIMSKLVFRKCMFFASTIDLQFFRACKSTISETFYYEDFYSMNKKQQEIWRRYLIGKEHLLSRKGWYLIELTPTSGEILIISSDIEIE